MKRAAVVTIHDMNNFGNRLQNFAVQTVLAARGFRTDNLLLKRRYFRGNVRDMMQQMRANLRRANADSMRYRRFSHFEKTRMRNRRFWCTQQVRRTRSQYDCFIVGSDQVWNPHFVPLRGPQFLDWARPQQRICLAPSFGVSTLPDEYQSSYSLGLNGFDSISVREDAGADLVRSLTGKRATVLIDPTLALGDSEWRAVASSELCPDVPYALTYFLGQVPEDRRAYTESTAAMHDLTLLQLNDHSSPAYSAGPAEFLGLIANASCVFTDSFHGSVFSLIFDTPMVIFERQDGQASMSSRIETFVRRLELKDSLYSEHGVKHLLEVDYSRAKKLLEVERERFFCYLDRELRRTTS